MPPTRRAGMAAGFAPRRGIINAAFRWLGAV